MHMRQAWRRLGRAPTLGAALALAIALATVAGAATRSTEEGGPVGSAQDSALVPDTAVATQSGVEAALAGVVSAVRATFTSGASPSAVAHQSSAQGNARSAEARAAVANLISSATTLPQAATVPAKPLRPGWGCGDKNHTHTGPPGNPTATKPCK